MTDVTEQIVRLLDKRMGIGRKIAEEKKRRGATQIRDLDREAEVLAQAARISDGTTPAAGLRLIIQTMMDVSSEDQAARTGLPLGGSGRK